MFLFNRASDDLNNNMVAVDTMEQFQQELDDGKVSGTTHSQHKRFIFFPPCDCIITARFTDCPDPVLWRDSVRGLDQENHCQVC